LKQRSQRVGRKQRRRPTTEVECFERLPRGRPEHLQLVSDNIRRTERARKANAQLYSEIEAR